MNQPTCKAAVADGKLKIEGDGAGGIELLGLFDTFTPNFKIVVPNGNIASPL
ncbi:hypothetical protein LMG26411_05063 [Cupriavidus numazuensis]|uniref:Alkyl sulfatase C-terminal domain-containing protein n=1 Tax=Cupriavidus numazuensis TaxID=221992 RepID=A0ABN7Q9I5_9BURK|nr:alkyl sulfatase C-terminal domain-containing protein [Cupriavidus numazuensis]CAG2155902.1 hypothetical protein LMG26411_05063 [Cupriavidus numazuensis]